MTPAMGVSTTIKWQAMTMTTENEINILKKDLFDTYGVLGFWGFGEIGRAHV